MSDPLVIWGAGAVGGTIGAYLAKAGHGVLFVDEVEDHIKAIRNRGLAIEGQIANFTVAAPAMTPAELEGTFSRIVLAVKAQHTEAATRALKPHLAADGFVLSAQNGLNELTIARIVGQRRTMGCFVNFGADYLEPGRILHGGRGAVVVGELDGVPTKRLEAMHRLLQDFEPAAVLTDNIWGYLWGKLGYGALLFATALTNESIADALASPRHFALFRRLGAEVMETARKRGVRPEGFNGFEPAAFLPEADRALTQRSIEAMAAHNRKSAKSHSGIWRDLAVRKRRTEVDAQVAPIVELGPSHGLATPLCARLLELIHDLEEGRARQGWPLLDALVAVHPGAIA